MKKKIAFPLFLAIAVFAAGTVFGQDNAVLDNTINMKLSALKDQHKQLLDMILDIEKDNAGLMHEHDRMGMSGATLRKRKMDRNKERIEELNLRKSDLKFKVIDTAGKLPGWWDEYEDWAKQRIRSYYNY